METLKVRMPLNPLGEVTVEAGAGSRVWLLRLFIFDRDLRYNPGVAALKKIDVRALIDALAKTMADAKNPENFNPVATRERSDGPFGGLSLITKFYPQGHCSHEFYARSSTTGHRRFLGDVPTVIQQLENIILAGDQMVAV